MTNPTLYIVSTPIGNLSDFSLRAQNILSSVSFILCEDTRHTLKLLHHFNIKNHLESLHLHNEKDKVKYILEKLLSSQTKSAALVSDAGTPAICDPGSYLVAAAHEHNIQIIIVSGPCSMTSAVAASGFIQPRTLFSGFMPKQKSEQLNEFEIWFQSSPCVAVFFESPRRVLETLLNLKEFLITKHCESSLSAIQICLSREMSKKFEEHKRFSLEKIIEHLQSLSDIQGECVVTVDFPKIIIKTEISLNFAAKESILISKLNELPLKNACKTVASKYSLSAKEIYALASQIKF